MSLNLLEASKVRLNVNIIKRLSVRRVFALYLLALMDGTLEVSINLCIWVALLRSMIKNMNNDKPKLATF